MDRPPRVRRLRVLAALVTSLLASAGCTDLTCVREENAYVRHGAVSADPWRNEPRPPGTFEGFTPRPLDAP